MVVAEVVNVVHKGDDVRRNAHFAAYIEKDAQGINQHQRVATEMEKPTQVQPFVGIGGGLWEVRECYYNEYHGINHCQEQVNGGPTEVVGLQNGYDERTKGVTQSTNAYDEG